MEALFELLVGLGQVVGEAVAQVVVEVLAGLFGDRDEAEPEP